MRTEKVSLTLDEALLAEAREVVGSRKLSSYVNHALRLQLQHDRLAGLLAEFERDKGPIEKQAMEEVRRAWPSPEEHPTRRPNG
jgi:Arc/MetJ family transcription regulator